MLALTALSAATHSDAGIVLQQDGYTVRAPAGFESVKLDLFRGTHAGAVLLEGKSTGALSAALVSGDGADASALLVSVVDESFEATPSMRDDFAAATVRHLNQELGLDFHIDSARRVGGLAPRIEVLGHAKREAQLRYFLIAGMEGEARHAVLTFSVSSGGWSAFEPRIEESLDSFRADVRRGDGWRRAGVIVAALAVALVFLVRRMRREE